MNTYPAEREGAGIDSWIVVDLDRISRLPDRLRRLWPPDLLPRRVDRDSRAASAEEERSDATAGTAAAGSGTGAAPPGMGEGSRGAKRDFDVLTAWLRGFASELNRVRSRISG